MYPVYQTLPPFPYLDANYVTRSTTNAICLPQENCRRQIASVVDDHNIYNASPGGMFLPSIEKNWVMSDYIFTNIKKVTFILETQCIPCHLCYTIHMTYLILNIISIYYIIYLVTSAFATVNFCLRGAI